MKLSQEMPNTNPFSKEIHANYQFACERCGTYIFEGEPFVFYKEKALDPEGVKICLSCKEMIESDI